MSPLIYISAVLFAVLCAFGVNIQINNDTYSFFEIVFNREFLSKARESVQSCSYILALNFSGSDWYAIGLAVLTTIPALYAYIKSIDKIHDFALIRTNYKCYSAGIVFSAFLSGFIIVIAGFLIYTAVVYLLFPSLESFSEPIYQQIYGDTVSRLFSLLKKVLNHALVGGIIPVFSIILYRFIRSDFLAASIPVMLMYISVKILPNYREWASWNENAKDNVFAQFLILIFPSHLTDLHNLFYHSLNIPFWLAYVFLCALLFVLYLIFYKSVRRV